MQSGRGSDTGTLSTSYPVERPGHLDAKKGRADDFVKGMCTCLAYVHVHG